MQQALLLALMNARYYQYQLGARLPGGLAGDAPAVRLRAQFYAGMSPMTGVPQTSARSTADRRRAFPSTPGVNTANSFTYATRFSPTGQVSTLNLGTVAGVGKLFSTGGQLLMGFANELVFNFAGKNPQQPTVLSALPISFVQPLLRGGGRAVILEPLTHGRAATCCTGPRVRPVPPAVLRGHLDRRHDPELRQRFNLAGFSTAGNTDPTIGFIPVVFNLVEVEIDRRNCCFLEIWLNCIRS